MSVRWDVLGIGVVAVDDLVYVRHFPEPDTKMQVEDERRFGGGLTATALVAASRLGARAAFCAVLDDDELSRYTLDELTREGVDCSPVRRQPGARPFHSTIIVDQRSGARTILYSGAGVTMPALDDVTEALVTACRVFFVDFHAAEAGLHAIDIAHAHGIPVVTDIEAVTGPAVQALLGRADHLIVGIELARSVTGENDPVAMVRALARPERACVAVTAGADGCWYAERNGAVRHCPAIAVSVVDTTGCGDVFHGAYAACLAQDETIDKAIQVATAAAGLKTRQPGGRAGIPDRATVEKFLQNR